MRSSSYALQNPFSQPQITLLMVPQNSTSGVSFYPGGLINFPINYSVVDTVKVAPSEYANNVSIDFVKIKASNGSLIQSLVIMSIKSTNTYHLSIATIVVVDASGRYESAETDIVLISYLFGGGTPFVEKDAEPSPTSLVQHYSNLQTLTAQLKNADFFGSTFPEMYEVISTMLDLMGLAVQVTPTVQANSDIALVRSFVLAKSPLELRASTTISPSGSNKISNASISRVMSSSSSPNCQSDSLIAAEKGSGNGLDGSFISQIYFNYWGPVDDEISDDSFTVADYLVYYWINFGENSYDVMSLVTTAENGGVGTMSTVSGVNTHQIFWAASGAADFSVYTYSQGFTPPNPPTNVPAEIYWFDPAPYPGYWSDFPSGTIQTCPA